MDESLLLLDCTAPVELSSLSKLSPAELALAALRPDVAPLVRQRAFHVFLRRWKAAPEVHDKDPILQSSLTFPLPSDESVESLSSSELLLLQFNSRCTSVSLASAAAERFLALAHTAHDRVRLEPAVALLAVQECRVERSDRRNEWREKDDGMILRVEEDGVSVVKREEDKRALLRFDAGDIQSFVYLAGADDGTDSMQCTLLLQLSRLSLGALTTFKAADEVRLVLDLGVLSAKDAAFCVMRATAARWAKEKGFQCTVQRPTQPPVRSDKVPAPTKDPEGLSSGRPSSSSSAGSRRASDGSIRKQEHAAKKRDPDEGSSSSRDSKKRRSSEGSARSSDVPRKRHCGWQFVSELPAEPEWNPGYYARQIALLSSIAPEVEILAPNFDPDELALLTRLADPAKLPVLPQHAADPNPDRKHVPTERLGIEHIYHDTVKSVDLNVTRRILFGNDYPDLASYAVLTSKVIKARDAVAVGYDQVLQHRLYPRRTDSTCFDPIDKLIELVEKMRDNPLYRRHILLDADGTLIRKNLFNEIDIGVGPHRRFCRALAEIVKYEREAGAIG
ncbi:hypothetical protein Rhopal_006336-T1 [Rhodotorula paludigena]|uniref:Uncharacterized protein n=1 Tax=Rhodotorula paludigena TaxID=86838 RepID=A0AAV5GVP9_9BASI|nr:hypothetical protein Rhopal_006336-T1 [Rhodotorula paludigena]